MDQPVADFWDATRAILNETPVDAALTECPERSGREYETWNIVLRSYGGQRLRGFYTVPRDTPASGRFPSLLAVPGYGGAKDIPYHVVMHGFAVLTLFPPRPGRKHPGVGPSARRQQADLQRHRPGQLLLPGRVHGLRARR